MTLYDIHYLAVHDPIAYRYPYLDTMPATRDLALELLPVERQPLAQGDGVHDLPRPAAPAARDAAYRFWRLVLSALPWAGLG